MIHASDIKLELNRAPLPEPPFCAECGYPVRCGTCWNCADQKARAHSAVMGEIARLGGLKAYQRFTLENFTNKAAVDVCKGYPEENLYLWGKAGTGKTHLATALLRAHPGEVVKPQAIFRAARGQTGAGEQAAIDKFRDMPYMVIDDLGIYETPFAYSVLVEIIDGRDMCCKKGLIITCNFSLDLLAEKLKDDRLISRIAGLCRIVEITGADKRLEAKQ